MLLLPLAYLAGVPAILSPGIRPVLSFVFTRSDVCFARRGLRRLIGLAVAFLVVSTLADIGNQMGRWIPMLVMSAFALALLWPSVAMRMGRPFESLHIS